MDKELHLDQGSDEIEQWVYREKIKMLYNNQRQSWLLSIIVAFVVAYLAYESDNRLTGIVWLLLFIAITLLRTRNTHRFLKSDVRLEEYGRWCKRFFWYSLAAGVSWGVGALLIGSQLDPLSQVFLLLILIGVTAAAIPLLGIYQPILLAFQVPAVVPYILLVSMTLEGKGLLLLIIFAIYMLVIVLATQRVESGMSSSLHMRYKMEQIADSLSVTNQELQDANEKLETLTLEDPLTGLNNRRYFEMQLEKEWKRAERKKESITLLVVDIDYFKIFNDSYGHAEGDECLQQVAHILKKSLHRPSDIIARIGGEEFVALLPGIDAAGALTVAQTMQENLQQAALVHGTSPVSDYVTVSIGIAAANPGDEVTSLGLFKAADKALYRGKAKGRNQIVVGEVEMLGA
ncbi:MAG: GGDEF domain-containing protein [Gammaproteobacteria bacterium]|nr:GGDEF domain-containing protein [Gammaproteobacteria bacterium]